MAAFNAMRCHPFRKPFFHRLRSAGKPHKVALTATARKFLTSLKNPHFIPCT
jgi:transposase